MEGFGLEVLIGVFGCSGIIVYVVRGVSRVGVCGFRGVCEGVLVGSGNYFFRGRVY